MITIRRSSRAGRASGRSPGHHAVRPWLPLVVVVAGCGAPPTTLTGSVTIDGVAAPAGISLEFAPTGPGTSAYARTDAAGRYEAQLTFRRRGIEPGEHRIRLTPGSSLDPAGAGGGMPEAGRRPPAIRRASAGEFPRRYHAEIERITVLRGRNRHDIALSTAAESP